MLNIQSCFLMYCKPYDHQYPRPPSPKEMALKTYINARLAIVVADYDSASLERNLSKVPMINEPGRKLFLLNTMIVQPLDWKRIKAHKRALGCGCKVDVKLQGPGGSDDSDTLYPLKHVYGTFKFVRSLDKASEDVLAVIVPGVAKDVPDNPCMVNAYKSLKQLVPKHVGPKIGTLTFEQSEVARSTGRSTLWQRKIAHHLLFTYQTPPGSLDNTCGRKRMKYLPGDTNVNEWSVPSLPTANMAKCTDAKHEQIWTDAVPQLSDEEDGILANSQAGLGDNVIPFPHEPKCTLCQEMIHVFGIDVLVDLAGGSGQTALAVLLENIRGIIVVRNTHHKTFLLDTLMSAVRNLRLVRHTPPAKSPELLAWEASTRRAVNASPAAATPVAPALPSLAPSANSSSRFADAPDAPLLATPTSRGTASVASPLALFGSSVLA